MNKNAPEAETEAEDEMKMGGDENVEVQETWVKAAKNFTTQDRSSSEKNGRYFVREWFQKHDWLAFNRERRKAFCLTCTENSDTQKGSGTFNFKCGEGFDNWKKGAEKFAEHEESLFHKDSCAKMVARMRRTSGIAETVRLFDINMQKLRRQGLISHLQTMKTLLRQGVAIRGNTDLDSNIYQFNLDKAIHDKGLELLLNEKHYTTAHDILVEQQQLLILNARRNLLENVREKDFFSILADESSDVSKKEQLSFSVRTCDDDYKVSEDFVGIFECSEGLSADALLKYTEDILLRSS
ncbi:zinc finger MYM-type protein 1-like [Dendronephthya gigantea]|uniref:zinc finger MYM-type protein 1-like n=1 Tax=Dendronephthya gigantea TaxID=151771 RepID=UPI00106D00E8|nr:zinc finger MYM-type protein 1-like [Dendronephthya gigantea]